MFQNVGTTPNTSAPVSRAKCLSVSARTLNFRAWVTPSHRRLPSKCTADGFQLVLQCLYSQCQTTQFGSALHQTLLACSGPALDTLDALPPLIRHQGLRKRGSPTISYASGHLSASAIHSVARRSVSASAYVSARPTRGLGHLPARLHDLPTSIPVTFPAPLSGAKLNSTSVLDSSTKAS